MYGIIATKNTDATTPVYKTRCLCAVDSVVISPDTQGLTIAGDWIDDNIIFHGELNFHLGIVHKLEIFPRDRGREECQSKH